MNTSLTKIIPVMIPVMTFAMVIMPLCIMEAMKEAKRKKKADHLQERASSLLDTFKNTPIDLMTTSSGRKLLSSNSTLNNIEKKIQFMEGSNTCGGFIFAKQGRSFDQRFSELEKRTSQLEQTTLLIEQ